MDVSVLLPSILDAMPDEDSPSPDSLSPEQQSLRSSCSQLSCQCMARHVGYFSSGWPVAYLMATVIFGVGLLIGSLMHVSQPAAGRQAIVGAQPGGCVEPKMELVGRITGMVDCKWEKGIRD